jgi:hypothetical protein
MWLSSAETSVWHKSLLYLGYGLTYKYIIKESRLKHWVTVFIAARNQIELVILVARQGLLTPIALRNEMVKVPEDALEVYQT